MRHVEVVFLQWRSELFGIITSVLKIDIVDESEPSASSNRTTQVSLLTRATGRHGTRVYSVSSISSKKDKLRLDHKFQFEGKGKG